MGERTEERGIVIVGAAEEVMATVHRRLDVMDLNVLVVSQVMV